jgi:hypothetical protein
MLLYDYCTALSSYVLACISIWSIKCDTTIHILKTFFLLYSFSFISPLLCTIKKKHHIQLTHNTVPLGESLSQSSLPVQIGSRVIEEDHEEDVTLPTGHVDSHAEGGHKPDMHSMESESPHALSILPTHTQTVPEPVHVDTPVSSAISTAPLLVSTDGPVVHPESPLTRQIDSPTATGTGTGTRTGIGATAVTHSGNENDVIDMNTSMSSTMDAKVLIAIGIISEAIEAEERLVRKASHLNVLREEVYMNSLRNASTEDQEEEGDIPGVTVDIEEEEEGVPGVTVDSEHIADIDDDFVDIVKRARSDDDDDDNDDDNDDNDDSPAVLGNGEFPDDQQISDLNLESGLDVVQDPNIAGDDNECGSDDDDDDNDDNSSGNMSRDERELRIALQSLDNGNGNRDSREGGLTLVDEGVGELEVLKDIQKDIIKDSEKKSIPVLNLSAVSSPSRIKPVQSPSASDTQNIIEKDVRPLATRRGFQNRIMKLDFAYQDEEQKCDTKADWKSPSDLIIRSLNTQSTRSDGSMDDKLDYSISQEKECKLQCDGMRTPQGLGQGVLGSVSSILSPESARYEQKLSARVQSKQASPDLWSGYGSGLGSGLGSLGDTSEIKVRESHRIEEKRSLRSPEDSTIEGASATVGVNASQSDFDDNYMKAQALLAMLEETDSSRAEGGYVHSSSSADTLPQSPSLPELSPLQGSADYVQEMKRSLGSKEFIRSSIRSSFSLPGELQTSLPAMQEVRDEGRGRMDRMEEDDETEESEGRPLTPGRYGNAALGQINEDDDGGEDEEKERDLLDEEERAGRERYPHQGLSTEEEDEEEGEEEEEGGYDEQAQEREALIAELSLCRQRIEERKKGNLVSRVSLIVSNYL